MAGTTAIIDRLTPFESYMFGEQHSQQPMSFFLRIVLVGPLDVEELKSAFSRAAAQHPLLTARVTRDAKNRLYWSTDPSASAVHLRVDAACDLPNTSVIDLESSSGLRAWLTGHDLEHVLWLEVHHACCDGQGLLAFLKSWQAELERSDTPSTALENGDGEWGAVGQRGPSLGKLTWRQAKRLTRFSLRCRILPIGDRRVETVGQRGFLMREISLPDTSKRRGTTGDLDVTVNDVLVASCFHALGRTLKGDGLSPENDFLRLCIPMNLREFAARPNVIANCVSMVFLDRRIDQLDDVQALLANVSQEMNYVKQHRIGFSMPHALQAFRSRLRVPPGRCMASAVLSNMGRLTQSDAEVWQLGSARITGIDLLPPLRQHTNIAIGVTAMFGKLRMAMHFNAAALQEPFVKALMDTLAENVQRSLG